MAIEPTIPELRLTAKTAQEIRAGMISQISNLTDRWTDYNDADQGIALLTIVSGLLDYMNLEVDRRASETTPTYVRQRPNGIRVFKTIGYQHQRKVPTPVTLRVELSAPATKPVPIYPFYFVGTATAPLQVTTRSSPALSFCTTELVIIPVGSQSVDIGALQGTPQKVTYVGTADPDQTFTLLSTDKVGEGALRVRVNGVWWEAVKSFVNSNQDSRHYVEETDEYDDVHIHFGDGVSGKIPTGTIEVFYLRTEGAAGSVFGTGRISNLITPLLDIDGGSVSGSVINIDNANGGEDEEDLFHIKKQAPREYAAQERAVTKRDLLAYSEGFPGVRQAAVLDINDVGVNSFAIDYFQIKIIIVPTTGTLPSAALKFRLQEYLEGLKAVPDDIEIIDPEYYPVIVSVDLYVKSGYNLGTVQANVEIAIIDFFQIAESPSGELEIGGEIEGLVFGQGVNIFDLANAILDVPGVASISSLTPEDSVTVDPYEIAILSDGSPIVNVLGVV